MTLWHARELAEHEFPEPTFLIEPILPLGGLGLVHGKRGVGKSQFSLTLAHAVSEGVPFLGRWPTLKGPVVVVQVDMTAQIQQLRVQMVMGILPLSNIYYDFRRTLNIKLLDRTHELVAAVNELEPVLVIWDTLRKIHRAKESASEAPQIVYGLAKELFPGPTHLFIHHDKKTVIDQDQLDIEELFRGSGDWIDSTDTSMQLVEVGNREPKSLALVPHKCRTSPASEKAPVLLEMDPESLMLLPIESQLVAPPASMLSHQSRLSSFRE